MKFYLSVNKNIFSKKVLALYFSEREADFSETVQPFLKIFLILLLKHWTIKEEPCYVVFCNLGTVCMNNTAATQG